MRGVLCVGTEEELSSAVPGSEEGAVDSPEPEIVCRPHCVNQIVLMIFVFICLSSCACAKTPSCVLLKDVGNDESADPLLLILEMAWASSPVALLAFGWLYHWPSAMSAVGCVPVIVFYGILGVCADKKRKQRIYNLNLTGQVSVTPRFVPLNDVGNDESADPLLQQKQHEKRQKARCRRKHSVYCGSGGMCLLIVVLSVYYVIRLMLPLPMTMVKVTNPDAKKGCAHPQGCEVTAIYVRLNVSKTCYGAPIYQNKRGNVLYKCNVHIDASTDTCTSWATVPHFGWCTGPAARIDDCCGGCCDQGDHYLNNFDQSCATATTPDLCREHMDGGSWKDYARWDGHTTIYPHDITVEFVQD
eukprot:COSAG01_NODE_15819_length_1296_cov_1.210526_2_plen_358_part_00